MLLVSLLWEVTLAVPYNWWSFQHHQMMGVFVGAWSYLPIEEVFVWIAVTYATAIVFSVFKAGFASIMLRTRCHAGREIGYTRSTGRRQMSQRKTAAQLEICCGGWHHPLPGAASGSSIPTRRDAAASFLLIPFFFGLPVSHRLLSRMAYLRLGEVPDAPALPSSFQRPPPPSLA